MRAWIALCLLVPVLAGCLSNDEGSTSDVTQETRPLDIQEVPDDAILQSEPGRSSLVWERIPLPFEHTFKLPEGATMVRFVATPDSSTVGVAMWNEDTGRRRCNQQSVVGFGQSLLGERSCSSITALDLPGANWSVRAVAPVNAPAPGEDAEVVKADVRIEFLNLALDGVAGMLDLDQLSLATHELLPTTAQKVPSWDGTDLWVEVTLPEGEGPWPTIISSSPYNGQAGRLDQPGGTPAMWSYWTQDWAKRGYAAINVDVRGFGLSGGCVEVWGENEQKDQAYIVDWSSKQPWSDGNVGFYGQSYVGTTPVEAAVQNPAGLKAIIAVAPVINSYEDWHYGGVPNGESSLSPVAYQILTDLPNVPDGQRTDLATILQQATGGICDPTLAARSNDPRAVYNEFYEERNFKLRAADIQAAVLFTEGFEDANVKSAMIPGWFNDIQAPKLGIFGHWLHQHPARMDQEVLFLAWMDQYVKGKAMGFEAVPNAVINVDEDHHRTADAWPPVDAEEKQLFLNLNNGKLQEGNGEGSFGFLLAPDVSGGAGGSIVLEEDLPIIAPRLHLSGVLDGENGFVYARLTEEPASGGSRLLTYGMINLALRNGYDTYDPLVPQTPFEADLPFRPTEHIAEAGSTLRLYIRSVNTGEALGVAQPQPGWLTVDGAGTYLSLPVVSMEEYEAVPVTAGA